MQTITGISSITLSTASGTLTGSGSANVSDGDTVTVGNVTYRFKNSLAQINDIKIGGSGNSDTSLGSLIKTLNGTGAAGTDYFAGTVTPSTQVTAGALTSHATLITAIEAGIYGELATTETSAVLSWSDTQLDGGSTITIVGTVSQQTLNFTMIPPQRVTVLASTANPNWTRQNQLVSGGIMVKRPNSSTAAISGYCLGLLGAAMEPSLSWNPIITTQPVNESCVHSSTAATFTTVAGVTESALSYQWQYYTGSAWVNCTGTINGCAYTNGTTASLTCTPTTTGQTGKQHQCVITNASGSTTTNAAILTIT